MKRFLPLVLALAFTSFAVVFTLFVVRPGIRSIRPSLEGWRHKVDEVIDELTEREEDDR